MEDAAALVADADGLAGAALERKWQRVGQILGGRGGFGCLTSVAGTGFGFGSFGLGGGRTRGGLGGSRPKLIPYVDSR